MPLLHPTPQLLILLILTLFCCIFCWGLRLDSSRYLKYSASTVKVTRCLCRGGLAVATSLSVAPWLKFSLGHDYGLFGANVRPGYCVHEIRLTTQCTAPHSAGPRFNCTTLREFYLQAIPPRPADPLTRAVNVTPAG